MYRKKSRGFGVSAVAASARTSCVFSKFVSFFMSCLHVGYFAVFCRKGKLPVRSSDFFCKAYSTQHLEEFSAAMDEEDYEKAKMLYDELKEMVSPGSNESKILKLDMEMIEADDKA